MSLFASQSSPVLLVDRVDGKAKRAKIIGIVTLL